MPNNVDDLLFRNDVPFFLQDFTDHHEGRCRDVFAVAEASTMRPQLAPALGPFLGSGWDRHVALARRYDNGSPGVIFTAL
jgi:hypothetical protein